MNFEKYKNRKWKDLSEDEKKEWDILALNLSPIQKLWTGLCERENKKKCLYCEAEFPEEIIRRRPYETIPLNAISWFSASFLCHCQTTHGYSPDIMDYFLRKIARG